jgi:signal peptidase II
VAPRLLWLLKSRRTLVTGIASKFVVRREAGFIKPISGDQAAETAAEPSVSPRTGLRIGVFLGIAIVGCAADWLTKWWIFKWPAGPGKQGEWWLLEGYVGIQHAWNEGALWGLGQGYVHVFATLSVCAAVGIFVWMWRGGAAHDWPLTIALGSITAGIFGNLHDRLGFWGDKRPDGSSLLAVRDWILFRYGEWTWPNFNIADCLLVGGAILLAWHSFRQPPTD